MARIPVHALGRTAVGLAGLVVAAVVALAVATIPAPRSVIVPPHVSATPDPAPQQRVCPGTLLELGADSTDATSARPVGDAKIVSAGDAGTPERSRLSAAGTDDDDAGGAAPTVLSIPAPPDATHAPLLAGSQSQHVATDTMTGTAWSACEQSDSEAWLVAGSSALGETSLIRLANPTTAIAEVTLSVYGQDGPVLSAASTVRVAPGSEAMVPLAGLAPGLAAPVVHVEASGGRVAASLQQSVVRGLEPGGVSLTGPSAPPSTHQVIPGVVIRTLKKLGSDGSAGVGPTLRVFVPGKSSASVRIGVAGEKGTKAAHAYEATLPGNTSAEIPLTDVPDGDYTVSVDSDRPLVAAVRTAVDVSGQRDLEWFRSAPALGPVTLAAVPDGAVLHVGDPGKAGAEVTIVGPDGDRHTITVPPGGAVPVALHKAGGYRVEGTAGLVASVSGYDESGLASFALTPPDTLAAPVTVYPR